MSKSKRETIQNYPKIKRFDNINPKYDEMFKVGETVIIQEKIDGSNVTIHKVAPNTFEVFSRKHKLTLGDDKGFDPLIQFVEKHKPALDNAMRIDDMLHGEWLGQGQIPYNGKAKKGDIPRLYIFDYSGVNGNEQRKFYSAYKLVILMEEQPYLTFVPHIYQRHTIEFSHGLNFNSLIPKKSGIDGESICEGIVLKNLDMSVRIKVVADKFKEVIKAKKSNKGKMQKPDILDLILQTYCTPARIIKFAYTYVDESIIDIETTMKNRTKLIEDILVEESIVILDMLKKALIKKAPQYILKALEENK